MMMLSPLAQGRGLKQGDRIEVNVVGWVAPRTGAWIETMLKLVLPQAGKSPLAQGRGLKLAKSSHLLRNVGRPSHRGVD